MFQAFSRMQAATFASFFILIFAFSVFGQTKNLQNDLERAFKKFSLVKVNNQTALQKSQTENKLSISTAERNYELILSPRDLRSVRYRAEQTGENGIGAIENDAPVTTFAGRVAGEENASEVRLSIDGTRIEGFFISGGEMFFVEPARRYSKAASAEDSVVYRGADALNQTAFMCDVSEKIEQGKQLLFDAPIAVQNPLAVAAPRVAEIATEADFEFVTTLGGAAQANSEILNILNMVEGVYRSELNLTISVVYQHVWTTQDPFTPTNSNTLLVSFKDYWNTNFPNSSVPRDVAHLFSAKATVTGQGIAYKGIICSNPNFAYGMTGRINVSPVKFELVAHEIGHNLGANHAEEAQSCGNSIMNATITNNTQFTFCAFSRSDITAYVAANNSCLNVQAVSKNRFDFDGDSRADLSVFRPLNGVWYLQNSNTGFLGVQFGQAGDKTVAGDYDGDGRADLAVFRAGIWYRLKSQTNTFDGVGFGLPTDLPVPADFDGDAKIDVAVFRPASGEWFAQRSRDGALQSAQFGAMGDVPLPADYDADGRADYNVFRPSNGVWYRLNSGSGNSFTAVQFGANGDKPVTGDFDGDAKADLVVFRPSNGVWYLLKSQNNSISGVGFGNAEDVPVAADYDGDGRADIAVFRPSNGFWYRLNSSTGAFVSTQFGASGDLPVPANPN